MLPPDLLALRSQMYATHTAYIQAQQGYFTTLNDTPAADEQRAQVQQCRTTGAQLDAALTALLDYLAQMDSTPERAAERDRTQQIQVTLHRELALLPENG